MVPLVRDAHLLNPCDLSAEIGLHRSAIGLTDDLTCTNFIANNAVFIYFGDEDSPRNWVGVATLVMKSCDRPSVNKFVLLH